MPLHLYWFLPSHGDGREVGTTTRREGRARTTARAPTIDYLTQVAQAVEGLGFTGMLVPFGLFCEDPWLVSTALATRTNRVKFMIALRSGLTSPLLTAQMAATFQRLSGNRLIFNVVNGSDADEQRRYGDWLPHDERYARTAEFLAVLSELNTGEPVDFDGEHHSISRGLLTRPAAPPEIHVGGSSEAARQVAAEHADVYLAWGEPPTQLGELMTDLRRRCARTGRDVRLGTRLHVISRDAAEDAWACANALIDGMDPDLLARTQRRFARTESEGQRRATALHEGRTADLEIYPNVWAGYGLVRPGTGVSLVGSHEEVADRIAEYHKCGIDHLILSGQPHLEEAYWFGEGVIPLLRDRGLLEEAT